MKKIVFFVPIDHSEAVKEAVFKAGAGKIGHYDQCCFETLGTGQFRPLEGSSAFLGLVGEVEKVEEMRVEMVCENNLIGSVIDALKIAHPYETPAYEVYSLEEY
ncbi:NGG1p interacting factor NIF3 [Halobacteriovorax sp. JY17]|uniref:NGG1p interacting factor NIF3 n=1 Tax=Halobacteriovorax sp. JY17 TaxID=2014617 RepID=UPI000C409C04|nr:NGG1p interacting factor NIF3 [Halobacteriovorax sp. JY17]PIK15803.1 MAG: NGG1p interacting factor NIF3 [Halobacteriovorax sp. JY17]